MFLQKQAVSEFCEEEENDGVYHRLKKNMEDYTSSLSQEMINGSDYKLVRWVKKIMLFQASFRLYFGLVPLLNKKLFSQFTLEIYCFKQSIEFGLQIQHGKGDEIVLMTTLLGG